MSIDKSEYARLKAWFVHFVTNFMPLAATMSAERHPTARLDEIERVSPAKARQGLAMAMGDILGATAHWAPGRVRAIDADFSEQGLPTLSELRVSFDRHLRAVLKRGQIRSDVEYHAVRNALEILKDKDGRAALWELVADFEEPGPKPRGT